MQKNQFSGIVNVFHEKRLPEPASPVGYAALIDAYSLRTPVPLALCAIGARHKIYEQDDWHIYTPRHTPAPSLAGHLVFALKYEGLDLAILKRLFAAVSPADLVAMIKAKPTSAYMRRVWFLYEWLMGCALDLPDATSGAYADIVDPKQQFTVAGEKSKRHHVRNNLPGSREFCPLVRRTPALDAFISAKLDAQASDVIGKISARFLARTAAFLLLKDSKSSYAIEGETPPQSRIQRWGKAIGEAGKHPLDENELLRLQRIVVGDARFTPLGFRNEGGFIGEHDRENRLPLPVHIGARHEDLSSLIAGMIDYDAKFAGELDPVIAAAVLAFGFVYIHPFADGNGRLHRYLIHHVLSARGFNPPGPPGMVFPVSSAIVGRITDYAHTLETYSQRLLPLIDWRPTDKMNVRVLNDTGDFYRYFDATPHAEFLFACVQKTIETDLPEEAAFLKRYDHFKTRIETMIEMPDSLIDLLFNFLKQNNGQLSARAREKEFAALSNAETELVENIYRDAFGDD